MCAPNLLDNLQKGGDNPADTIFEGLQEESRLQVISRGGQPRGGEDRDLEENSEAIKVVRPKFNKAMFPNAIFREGCMN